VNGTRKHTTEDKNKLTLLAFKIIAILHNYMAIQQRLTAVL
jgi:hypothetical protein